MPTSVERQRAEIPLAIGGGIRQDVQRLRISAPNALKALNVHADKLGGIQRRPSWTTQETVASGSAYGTSGGFAFTSEGAYNIANAAQVIEGPGLRWDRVGEQDAIGVLFQMSTCVEYSSGGSDYVLCGWLAYSVDAATATDPDRNLFVRVWDVANAQWFSDTVLVDDATAAFDLITDPDDGEVYLYRQAESGASLVIRSWDHATLTFSTTDTIVGVDGYSIDKNSDSVYVARYDLSTTTLALHKIRSGVEEDALVFTSAYSVASGILRPALRLYEDEVALVTIDTNSTTRAGYVALLDESTAAASSTHATGSPLTLNKTANSNTTYLYRAGKVSSTYHFLAYEYGYGYSGAAAYAVSFTLTGSTVSLEPNGPAFFSPYPYVYPVYETSGTATYWREFPEGGTAATAFFSRLWSAVPDFDFSGPSGTPQLLDSSFKNKYQLQHDLARTVTVAGDAVSLNNLPVDYVFTTGTPRYVHLQYQEEGDFLFLPKFEGRGRLLNREVYEHSLLLFKKDTVPAPLAEGGGIAVYGQPLLASGGTLRSASVFTPTRVSSFAQNTASGALTSSSTYQYAVVLRDVLGRVRSAPHVGQRTLGGSDDTLDIFINASPFTPSARLDEDLDPLVAEVYVSEADGSTLYLASVLTMSLQREVRIISVDTSQPVLYTTGGELPAEPFPNFKQLVTWQGRYVGLPFEGDRVWPSKQERPEWSLALTIPAPEKLYAIAPLGGVLLGFGEERVWATGGEGPDATGFNGQWAPWQDLSTVSPINPEAAFSVCEIPGKGVLYQSVRGFTLITRETSEDPSIGDKVEDYTRGGVWECVYHDTARHTLYFAEKGGGTEVLALDTDLGEWFVHTAPSTQLYGGQRQSYLLAQNPSNSSESLLLQPGTSQIGDDYVASPAAPVFSYRTAWFKPAPHLASQARYTHVNVTVGDTVSPDHPYTIKVYTDGDETTPTDTFTIPTSSAGNVQRGGYIRTRHQLSRQVANAICVEVEQAPASATGTPDFELVDITLSALVPNTLQPGWGADQAVKG